jgi:Ca-activated chloride channel family protein
MAALDMNGVSRCNASRDLLKDFAERRPADNIGLVALGSDASLLTAPTADRRALYSRLDQLRIGELGDGTALGDGLAIAALHLEKSSVMRNAAAHSGAAPRRAVILVTDGENNAGAVHPETAAAMLGTAGISLWVIGVGSGGEVPIDYTDPVSGIRRTGLYDSRFNTESLMRISQAGGGEWLPAHSAGALHEAFALIDDREMVVGRVGLSASRRSCHAPFLAAALLLLAGVRFIRRFFLGALT